MDYQQIKHFLQKPYRYYIGKFKKNFWLGISALIVTNLLDVLTPLLLKKTIDIIQEGNQKQNLGTTIALFTLVLAAIALFRYLWRIYFGQFHHGVANDLRESVYKHLTSLTSKFYNKTSTGEIMSVVTNDISAFRMGIGPGILVLVDSIGLMLFIIPAMMYLSVEWTIKCLILAPFVPFIMAKMEVLIHARFKEQQDNYAKLSAKADESVSGVNLIKANVLEKIHLGLFRKRSQIFEKSCNTTGFLDSLFMPILEFTVATGSVILLFVSQDDIASKAMTIGTLIAFHRYIQKMVWPMGALGWSVTLIQQSKASLKRISGILSEVPDVKDTGTKEITKLDSLEIKDLSFCFPKNEIPALKNINANIKAGEITAFVGGVGSGKSSLVQLICRLWPIDKGSIKMNGLDSKEYTLESLRSFISYVPQEPFLFKRSAKENLLFGTQKSSKLTPQEETKAINSVLESVDLKQYFKEQENGIEVEIGERGVNLSGGQKQRLTIARALLRNSPLTIFDDSLSAVDQKTEKHIISTILAQKDKSHIIVTHKFHHLKYADQIILFDQGEIKAQGTLSELLQNSDEFNRLFEEQIKTEQQMKKKRTRHLDEIQH